MRFRLLAAGVAISSALATVVAVSPAAAAGNPVVTISPTDTQAQLLAKAASVTPTDRQLAWQREELTGFVHFGPNTYTGRDLGLGTEDPDIIQPAGLDTDQWVSTFKDAGFKKIIFTAKHHDGMLMYPSAYSTYDMASSSYLNGTADLVKSFTDSARKFGVKVGIYLSPSDLHEYQPGGTFGNGSAKVNATIPSIAGTGPKFDVVADDYNRLYMNTLYELLTKYGTVDEVWFDGYDPTGGRQPYNFTDWVRIVRTLQPTAVTFGGDVRWVGNESGVARTSEWSVIPNNNTANPDGMRKSTFGEVADNIAGDDKLTTASSYLAWFPGECDAKLQPSWFWHPNQTPKTLSALMSMYYASVGRNCQLLLNVGPNQQGKIGATEVTRMAEFGAKIRSTFATNQAAGATAANDTGTSNTSGNVPANVLDANDGTGWQPSANTGGLVVDLPAPKAVNTVVLQENIQVGQRVAGFAVDTWNGTSWQQVTAGTTVGYKRIVQFPTVSTQKVRLRITASRALAPSIATLALYDDGSATNLAQGKPSTQSSTSNSAPASRAVDGNTHGDFFANSVTHTNSEASPWWQVDLGASVPVGKLALWNRTDCCANRLTDYWVFVSDTPFNTSLTPAQQAAAPGVWSSRQTGQAGTPTQLTVGKTGRYVMVRLAGTNPLSLAEVQVFAPANDFSLAASQPMTSVPAGQATTSTVTTAVTKGATGPITLSAANLPPGATATFNPVTVTAGGTSTLTIQTSASTPPGDSIVDVIGTAAEVSHSAQVTVSVVAASADPVVSGQRYQVRNALSGKAVDVPGNATTAGTQLIQWAPHSGDNQRWTFTKQADGSYEVRSVSSGLCMDATTNSGEPVVQWTCHGGSNQRWSLVAATGGHRLVAKSSGKVLTVAGTGDGLTQAAAVAGSAQSWIFVTP
ncbi:Alpha-L-fucosidase [Actinokineospora alba]|uniref:alpha-L-fucosidase n=1 Tax=Actinokineospora alba TaxID=504798 RepID=A0A1H0FEA4_9PSEU|nr:RICIN domain-containing protein [Actinokineospora alba]TDP69448.1 alpha-L-fucosidase [Actinokineospora alba]SDI16610.1 Alpha-L-fucosidase [Actinokineospora alba]SDN93048.1 Alpha-L-fucosidase [Actinokineospora alba]